MIETILIAVIITYTVVSAFFFGMGVNDREVAKAVGFIPESFLLTFFRALIWPVGLALDIYYYFKGENYECDY